MKVPERSEDRPGASPATVTAPSEHSMAERLNDSQSAPQGLKNDDTETVVRSAKTPTFDAEHDAPVLCRSGRAISFSST